MQSLQDTLNEAVKEKYLKKRGSKIVAVSTEEFSGFSDKDWVEIGDIVYYRKLDEEGNPIGISRECTVPYRVARFDVHNNKFEQERVYVTLIHPKTGKKIEQENESSGIWCIRY